MCGLGCGIGLLGGIASFVLQVAIVLCTHLFFEGRISFEPISPSQHQLGVLVLVVPPLGGLLVGMLAYFGSPAIRGHGIPETMETILVARGRIAPRMAILKPLATSISIGSGGPFGMEGPIIQTGGALGSLIGQLLSTTAMERKILIAAGAAAGMAATFSAPVAAVFLAIELLLFEFRFRSLLPVALASSVGAGMRWLLLGSQPLYPLELVHQLSAWDLPLFVLLGLASGLVSVGLTRSIGLIEEFFGQLPVHWMWWPMLGGVVIGVIGLIFCPALGVGAEHVRAIVGGQPALPFLLAMLIWKAAAWAIGLGSGTSGGVLGPLLLIGAALGGVLASTIGTALPAAQEPGLWAVACMAAVFAGATRAPLTAVILGLELTHEPMAFLPLLIACAVSDLISLGMLRHSIMTEKIAKRGLSIGHEYELDSLAAHVVGQMMTTDVTTVPVSLPLTRLFELVYGTQASTRHQGYPVVEDAGRLIGMVTRSDLPDIDLRQDLGWLVVADVMSPRAPVVAYPDESLREAAERMLEAGVGRLPVVAPEMPDRIVGILSRSDVLKALARRAEEEHKRERLIKTFEQKSAA
jgi:H+/Cl- antiporter ClcA